MPCPKPRRIEKGRPDSPLLVGQARNFSLLRRVLRVLPVIFNWTLEGDLISEQAVWELPVP
jgi:hypothetical protein